jgi:HK97 family phage major capsid protein
MANPILDATRAKRTKALAKLDELMATPTKEARELTDDESTKFEELSAKIKRFDADVDRLLAEDARKAEAERAAAEILAAGGGDAGTGAQARVTSEPMTYDKYSDASYFRDIATIAAAQLTGADPSAARERLSRHAREVEVEARTNPAVREMLNGIQRDMKFRSGAVTDFEKRVNPNTTAGTGGEFVPPLWKVSDYAKLLRPGRVFANRVSNQPLPPGIDVINWPKITVGTLTAVQAAQGGAVSSQDIQTSTVSAPVNTIAGQEDISLQLLEQSPLAMDGVIFDDLGRDYDQRLDIQVVAGTGTNGQHLGVLNVSSASSPTVSQASAVTVSSATFHDASTSGTQYRSIVKGVNQIETLTFSALPPTAVWVHPRRANSWAYASDSQNRPLFIPAKYGQFNTLGTEEGAPVPEGVAGEVFGLPVVKDANMPTTMNGTAVTGGTADAVVVLNESVPILFEGTMRMRALPEVLSGTLQIRFQLYNYSAFMPTRFPQAISILTGNTGLAAPGF